MFRWLFIALTLLAACGGPSPYFRAAPATRITVADSVFDVRVRGALAEAVRINPQYAPRFGPIRGRAAFAMAKVSGCKVVEIRGDQAVATGVLSCDGRPPPVAFPRETGSFSCLEISLRGYHIPGGPYPEYDCDPY
ncbi:hypothetical protein [Sedimentitalea nanhaiensis]|uniref:Lipoprotein n=1 Tax=Sedimentitalea nanhaiensis TaxID=999627 RepID=A0A1I6X547_9RHOB|nr:hypothetical protein [Sedimentitalea nanhaiensis]SFT33252.1 hypothetical protein SAMN05216236_10151 [Sedimentitalea nanhaiensis]